ncbi:hypothetical protein FACS18945_4890 [Bacteroidia bacterium]|nr:hypothetical protein FACS18945_4890 [Bacteroidia bacterium]
MRSVGGIETHSDKLLRAIELYLSGKTQSEAAHAVGLHPSVVGSRIRKYDVKILPDHICEHCGNAFPRTGRSNRNRYCSKECAAKASYVRYRAKHGYKRAAPDPERRAAALELYWGGLNGAAISRYLGVPEGTVSSWIHHFGGERERLADPDIMALAPPKESRVKSGRLVKEIRKESGRLAKDDPETLMRSLELYWGGLSVLATARYLNVKPRIIYDWVHEFGSARERLQTPEVIEIKRSLEKGKLSAALRKGGERRERALGLYWGGVSGSAIARFLRVSQWTVYSWIRCYGPLRDRQPDPVLITIVSKRTGRMKPCDVVPKALRLRLKHADSPEQWAHELRDDAHCRNSDEAAAVHLVCGATTGNSGVSVLASIVIDKLKENPMSGDIYAFCNKKYDTVTTIRWHSDTFKLTVIPKRYGVYIWPPETLGMSVKVTEGEFEYLLAYEQKTSKNVTINAINP